MWREDRWKGEFAMEIPARQFWTNFKPEYILHHFSSPAMDAYMLGVHDTRRMVAIVTPSGRIAAVFKRAFITSEAKTCFETYKVVPFIRKDVHNFLTVKSFQSLPAFYMPHEMATYSIERSIILQALDLGCCTLYLLLTPPPFAGQIILYLPADGSDSLIMSGRVFYTLKELDSGRSYHQELKAASF